MVPTRGLPRLWLPMCRYSAVWYNNSAVQCKTVLLGNGLNSEIAIDCFFTCFVRYNITFQTFCTEKLDRIARRITLNFFYEEVGGQTTKKMLVLGLLVDANFKTLHGFFHLKRHHFSIFTEFFSLSGTPLLPHIDFYNFNMDCTKTFFNSKR